MASAYEDWLKRGRVHVAARRPIDAMLCFRRATQIRPDGADARFLLGEMLWRVGLAGDAVQAWRDAAQVNSRFVAPRIALAEALLTLADYDGARSAAAEAVALAPDDRRARAALSAAASALGVADAFATAADCFSAQPNLAMVPGYAAALARALDREPRGVARNEFTAKLVSMAGKLPSVLLVTVVADAFADNAATLADVLRTRAWQGNEIEALRRIIIAVHPVDPVLARELASTHAAMCIAEPLVMPSLWPTRTGGEWLRIAWLMPAPDDTLFAPACAVLRTVLQRHAQPEVSVTIVCAGDSGSTRAALPELPATASVVALPPVSDSVHARALAANDPDVLIDLAGLRAGTGLFLAARPARNIWSLAFVAPGHAPALVERVYATSEQVAEGLRALGDATTSQGPGATELAEWWNAAVRAHQQGDESDAIAGYARVLAAQPDYAPAHRLGAALARDRGNHAAASTAFARAIALAPDDAETRVAAAQLAVAAHEPQRAADMLREGLERTPYRVELWNALGHAELAHRDGAAAAQAFDQALRLAPAGGQTYFNLGVALQMTGNADEAALAYQRAMVLQPDFAPACFNLGVLFQQQGRVEAAIAAYRQALALNPRDAAAYKNLGEVLFAAGQVDAWLANFRVFEAHCPASLSLAVQALEVCQLTGDQDRLDYFLDGLRREKFPANDELELVDALEELLFLLLNFDVEPEMLFRFASTYDAASTHVYGAARPHRAPRRPGKLRLGYLSGDLRDHVMGKQMWQAISRHDRDKFDLYFYATVAARDAWTENFEGIAHRFDVVANLGDAAAADRIAGDDLDLLVDLSTHTKGARPGILATKPARVQMTHIASCGAVGLSAIDYKLTDRFADLPENQAFILETLLPMEGCVYPWRHVSPTPGHLLTRSALGIDADTFVIGAFVSPLKLSRRCLALWRDVLQRVPRGRLLFSPNNAALRPLYVKIAIAAGIAANRLLFLPQGGDEHENQSRYELVDIVLDTLPYGGVNGTMEALAMGVPVVTLVGKRHGERSTYSILANLGVTATVAQGGREYADIAVRLATDPAFMAEVRGAIRANLQSSALTDMEAHTRHLEAAYLRAIAERAAATPESAD